MERVKILFSELIRIVLHIFYMIPIKRNRVIFNSYMGRQYSCNPKYISEYLVKKFPYQFDIVWCFNEPDKYDFLKRDGIKVCKTRSLSFYLYSLTSRVSVCNATRGAELPKRKGQYLINTWHGGGGGYKKINAISNDDFRSRREKREHDLFCASSETSLKNTVRIAFEHKGDFLPGTPRNDMFVNQNRDDIVMEVRRYFSIDNDFKVILYAPTFRGYEDIANGSHDYGLEIDRFLKSCEKKFGGKWLLLIRYHFLIKHYSIPESDNIIDATKYPDMQDLLYAADILVTDYSSSIWDFSFTYKPCILFCNDLKKYEETRGFNKPIEMWRFPICRTNDELEDRIMMWDQAQYEKNMKKHHEENGSFEDGTATKRIVDIICQKCNITS